MFRLKIFVAAACFAVSNAGATATGAGDGGALYQSLVGAFLAAQKQHRRAAVVFGELGVRLNNPDFLREAVSESITNKDYAAAIRYAESWDAMSDDIQAKQVKAELLLIDNQLAAAERELEILMSDYHQPAEDLYRQLFRAADKTAALNIGRRLFAADAESQSLLAKMAANNQDWAAMESAIARGLAADGEFVQLHFLRLLLARQRDGGEAVYRRVKNYLADGCPGAADACREEIILFAFVKFLRGDKAWRQPLQKPAQHQNGARLAAGEFFERNEMRARAKVFYSPVADIFFAAKLGLARIVRDEGDLQAAVNLLTAAAVKNRAEFVRRETTLAHLLNDLQKSEQALARIVRARENFPDDNTLLYTHSLLAEENGDLETAIGLLIKMASLYPRSADAWNALGYLLADNNLRLAEAEKYIRRALKIKPDDANILDSLGWVKYRLGEFDAALKYLKMAAASSDSAEIAAHLGELLWRGGQRDAAKKVWQQSLQKNADNKVLNETLIRFEQSLQ